MFFQNFLWLKSDSMQPYQSIFFNLLVCTEGSSMSFQSSVVHFFVVLSNSPLPGCTTIYLFTDWRTPGHLQVLAIVNFCKYPCAGLCVDIVSHSFAYVSRSVIAACPPTVPGGSYCSTLLSAFEIVRVSDFGHYIMCVVLSHCWKSFFTLNGFSSGVLLSFFLFL